MAVTSFVYGGTLLSLANKEIDFDTDTLKIMLCTAAYVPDKVNHRYKASITAEVSGPGYTAGGKVLTGVVRTYDAATNQVRIDADNVGWGPSTITARYAIVYDDTPTTNKPLIGYIDFGADVASNNSTLQITFSELSMFRLAPGLLTGGQPEPELPPYQPTAPLGGTWELKFNEDFTTGPDPKVWTEYWLTPNGSYRNATTDPNNTTVSGGEAQMTLAAASSGAVLSTNPWDGVPGHVGYSFGLGYVEARIWIPGPLADKSYNWVGFSTRGQNWPTDGQADVVETAGWDTNGRFTINYHYDSDGSVTPVGTYTHAAIGTDVLGSYANSWHTYGVHRKADVTDWYWDGVKVFSTPTRDDGRPHFFVFNVGQSSFNNVYGNASTMRIDYVRQWVQTSTGGGTGGGVEDAEPTSGTLRYVSSSTGSDSNPGTKEAPWRSLNKVRDALVSGEIGRGDYAMFKRGDTFYGSIQFPVIAKTAGVFTMRPYGSGALPKVSGYKISNNAWVQHSTGIWRLNITANSGQYTGNTGQTDTNVGLLMVGGQVKGAKKLSLAACTSQWDFYSDATNVYVRLDTNPGAGVEISVKQNGIRPASNSEVWGMHVIGHGAHGFAQYNSTNINVHDCVIEYIGGSLLNADTRYGNGIEVWIGNSNTTYSKNVVRHTYDCGVTMQGTQEGTTTQWNNVHIDNNTFENCFQTFEIWSRGSGTGWVGCSFNGNTSLDAGYSWSAAVRGDPDSGVHFLSYDMQLSASGLEIANNTFRRAKNAYAYCTWPIGAGQMPNVNSHDNLIVLEPGRKIVWQNSETIEQAAAWKTRTGKEVNSVFQVYASGGSWDAVVSPGQSIQAALDANQTGRVGLQAGTYRLTDKLRVYAGQTIASVDPNNKAVLKGSVIVTGFLFDSATGRWYKDGLLPPAYTDAGQCEVISGTEANLCNKREQIFVNGVHLQRYGSVATMQPGGFFQDYTANRTWVYDDPNGKTVEMSKYPYAINSAVANVTVRDLVVQHFATPSQFGAVTADAANWTITGNEFSWNHAIGLHVSHAPDTKVLENKAFSNGQLGMGAHRSDRVEFAENEIAFNNTDGYWGGDWESGGLKVTYTKLGTAHHNNVHDNQGIGIWFDIDNIDADIHHNYSTDNYADGIRFEISYRSVIHENIISGNGIGFVHNGGRGADMSILATGGININSAPDVEVWGNTLINNEMGISGQSRARGAGEFGPYDTVNLYVHHNDITLKHGLNYGEGVSGFRSCCGADSTYFYSAAANNRFDHNTYRVVGSTERRFAWNHTYLTFANLRAAGQELNGTLITGGQMATPYATDFGTPQHEDGTKYTYPNLLNFGPTTTAPLAVAPPQRGIDLVAHWYNDFGLDHVALSSNSANGWWGWYDWQWNFPTNTGDRVNSMGYDPSRHPLQGFYKGDDANVLGWQCYWLAEAAGIRAVAITQSAGFTSANWSSPSSGSYWVYQLFHNVPNFQALKYLLAMKCSGTLAEMQAQNDDMVNIYATKGSNAYTYFKDGKRYACVTAWEFEQIRGTLDNYNGQTNTVAYLKGLATKFKTAGYDGVMILARNGGVIAETPDASLEPAGVIVVHGDYENAYATNAAYGNLYSNYAANVVFPTSTRRLVNIVPSAETQFPHPSGWTLRGSTPQAWAQVAQKAVNHVKASGQIKIITIYNVSEWAEGGPGLIPQKRDGFGYLDALRNLMF